MPAIQVDVRIYRCDETQQAAALFVLPENPLVFLLGTTGLLMLLQENPAFNGLVSSFQYRTVTQFARYGTPQDMEETVRNAFATALLMTWHVMSISTHTVDQADLRKVLSLTE